MVQSTTNYVCLQIHDKLFSIIISPLDVKNCGLFCLHGVFSLKERGGGVFTAIALYHHRTVFYLCMYLQFTKSGEKKEKTLSFRKIGHVCVV